MTQRVVLLLLIMLLPACAFGRGDRGPKDIAAAPPPVPTRMAEAPRRTVPKEEAPQIYVVDETEVARRDENGRLVIPPPPARTSSMPRSSALDELLPITVTNTPTVGAAETSSPASDITIAAVATPQAQTPSPRSSAAPPSVPATSETAQRPARGAPRVSAGSAYALHLASYRGPETAEAGWEIYRQQFSDILAPLSPVGVNVTIPEKGDFVRLLAGPIEDLGTARRACDRLAAYDQYCVVMRFDGSSL